MFMVAGSQNFQKNYDVSFVVIDFTRKKVTPKTGPNAKIRNP